MIHQKFRDRRTLENVFGFVHNTPAPAHPDLDERFKHMADQMDAMRTSLELMIKLLDERLTSFEARLPSAPAVKARLHDQPLFSCPP